MSDGGMGCKRLCDMSGEPLVEGMLVGTSADLLDTAQTHQLQADIDDYKGEYLRRWQETELDALITPVTPWVGYKPWTWVKSNQYVGYTTLCNLLDWPGLAIPVTKASKERDCPVPSDWENHKPRNISDEFNHQQYDIDLVQDIPVGVQIMAGKYGDEKCVAIAKVIEEIMGQGKA
jgi:amidase